MSGSDAKEELEFYDVSSVAWEPAGAPGLWQRVLAGDKTTGDHTRILRFDPGTVTSETLRHDFWEEAYVLEGSITDLRLNETFGAGMFAFGGMKGRPSTVLVERYGEASIEVLLDGSAMPWIC